MAMFQAILGLQFSKVFGIDLGYTQMRQEGKIEGVNVALDFSGFEMGINFTF